MKGDVLHQTFFRDSASQADMRNYYIKKQDKMNSEQALNCK